MLVATVRALKSHGGVAKADLNQPNLEAVKAGASNLIRHIDNLKNGFGLPVVVAINAFPTDTAEEQAYVEQVCAEQGVPCVLSEVFAKGGEGGKALAEKVLEILEDRPIQYTYPLEMPLKDKINAIAAKIYRADGVNYSAAASKTLAELTEMGYGNLPVCIAKTQYSFSDNAKADRCTHRLYHGGARGASGRRCWLCGRHLRQHHDHARPAQKRPSRREHRCGRRRQVNRPVLIKKAR